MLYKILITLVAIQIVTGKTIHKRQVCDTAIDLTRVAGSCTQFHRCFSSGYYAVVNCPSGYEFDTVSKSCRPDSEVVCVTRGNECADETDYTRVANDCRKFYRCINGYLSTETCQDGLVYNGPAKACDWPQNVAGCEYTYWGNECDANIDLTRTSNDCTKFYRCDRGWLKTEVCPDGLVFDNNAKVCNWPNLVPGCEYTFWGNECDANIDLTRTATDCTKFHRCDRGWLKTEVCPDGLVFDNNAKVCNWPNLVQGCEYTFWGNECDANTDLTRTATDCTKYYRCDRGWLKTEVCPNGLYFDNVLKRCEWANQVSCGTVSAAQCTADQDLTQVSGDCSRFNKCINGKLSTETCPNGYYFDRTIRACNVAFLVSCSTNVEAPKTCNSYDDLTQVAGKCNLYYRCVNGVLTTESCDSGFNFDRALRACNIANQVYTCV